MLRALEESNYNTPGYSFNISPPPQNVSSNELKDFTCEENWQSNDLKELLIEQNTEKPVILKKKLDFPKIKITDIELKIDIPSEKTPNKTPKYEKKIEFHLEKPPSKTPKYEKINEKLNEKLTEKYNEKLTEKLAKLESDFLELQSENSLLKAKISELNANFMQEIEKNQLKEVELTKNNQNQRRQTLDGLKIFPQNFLDNFQTQDQGQGLENIEKAFQQLENLTNEKKAYENRYYKLKREYEEEKAFLEEELKNTEETAIEAKLQFAIISTEKDYYEHELKVIIQELKKKKINIGLDKEKGRGKGLDWFMMCNCK